MDQLSKHFCSFLPSPCIDSPPLRLQGGKVSSTFTSGVVDNVDYDCGSVPQCGTQSTVFGASTFADDSIGLNPGQSLVYNGKRVLRCLYNCSSPRTVSIIYLLYTVDAHIYPSAKYGTLVFLVDFEPTSLGDTATGNNKYSFGVTIQPTVDVHVTMVSHCTY